MAEMCNDGSDYACKQLASEDASKVAWLMTQPAGAPGTKVAAALGGGGGGGAPPPGMQQQQGMPPPGMQQGMPPQQQQQGMPPQQQQPGSTASGGVVSQRGWTSAINPGNWSTVPRFEVACCPFSCR